MTRKFVGSAIVMTLCVAVSPALSAPRGGGGNRSGSERTGSERTGSDTSGDRRSSGSRAGSERSTSQSNASEKPPGGDWTEHNPNWRQGNSQFGNAQDQPGADAAAAGRFAGKQDPTQASGAEGAAAGTAAAKRNAPSATGAQGAAAASAASKRNAPAASGAQDAAAGAAVANRNAPQATGAQGAAAGAAAANRNAPSVTVADGADAGVAVVNNNAPEASGAEGAAAGYVAASGPVEHPNSYDQQWYADHQNAWSPTGWDAGAAWAPVTWEAVAKHCGYANITPVRYDYGNNITCIGGNVAVNGQPAGTAEEFSWAAADIARAGTAAATSATDQWLPLGVFALVRDEHHHPHLMMQLAINQQGIVRGNYTDEVTGNTLPVHGEVDQQTQRAAWTVGDNRYSVMEAGLSNLTEHEAPALVHKNGTTERWLLVRPAQPSQGGTTAAPVAAPR